MLHADKKYKKRTLKTTSYMELSVVSVTILRRYG